MSLHRIKFAFYTILFALFMVLAVGCDNSDVNPLTSSDTTSTVVPAAKKTCLSGKVASGTYAVNRSTGEKVSLDANGCFDFGATSSKVAARAMTSEDTIIFKNDSSLFSLTIPFYMLGDTVQMMQTDMAIRNARIGKYDSVIAIIFDKSHIKERKAVMRKASSSSKTDWSIKFYSPVNGNDFLIHFEFHKGNTSWTSELITAEVGSSFNGDTTLDNHSTPVVLDTTFFKDYDKDSSFNVRAYSIYGIAKMYVDGKESNVVSDTQWGIKSHSIKVLDSAGYSSTLKINIINGKFIPDSLIKNNANMGGLDANNNNVMFNGYILDSGFVTIGKTYPNAKDTTVFDYSYSYKGHSLSPVSNYAKDYYFYIAVGENHNGLMIGNRWGIPFIY